MDRVAFLLYRAFSGLISLLTPAAACRLGHALGWLVYYLTPKYRRLAQRNLRIAFGKEKSKAELRALAHLHFCKLGANLLGGVRISQLPAERIMEHVEVEGEENVRKAVRDKLGFVAVIAHIGSWEFLATISPIMFGCPVGTVYQKLGNPYMDAEVRAARGRLGLKLFERSDGFNAAMKMLRSGGSVGMLVDQHAGDAGIWVPFFGRLASTTTLPAMIALRTGAALVPMAVYLVAPGKWRFVASDPVDASNRDISLTTGWLNSELENQIRRSPAEWFWVHNRWKTPKPKFLLSTYKRGTRKAEPALNVTPELQPFKIVIRSPNWLGDAVMSIPAVRCIKRGRPDAHVTIAAPAKLREVWEAVSEVDAVIPIERKESVFGVAAKLRRGEFEAAILLPNSLRSALEVWLAGIPRRVGRPGHSRTLLLNQVLQAKKEKKGKKKKLAPVPKPPAHHRERYLELAGFVGADVEDLAPASALRTRAPGPLRIGICPGAEYGAAKRWLPERFTETMKLISAAQPTEWSIVGVDKDAPIGEAILKEFSGEVRNLIGKTTLSELIAELRQLDCLISNDTGTMHLAAFLGTPVVAIFGSTEPALTSPTGPHVKIIRHHVNCSPCFLRECPIDFRCMKAVQADEAAKAALELIASAVSNRE